jgi:hypothetical protein
VIDWFSAKRSLITSNTDFILKVHYFASI